MQRHKYWFLLFSMLPIVLMAQGPPITSDKPIMLSEGTFLVKTLVESRRTDLGTYTYVPIMFHYIPTRNTLVSIHVPGLLSQPKVLGRNTSFQLADIVLQGKYQFFRKDMKAKTLRMVVKTLQTLGTGEALGLEGMSSGNYQSYFGWVTGYESLRYGLSNELGFNVVPANNEDELRWKFGVGLPLLKPSYPVNQVNLYFEYVANWYPNISENSFFYAQGIQYAKGRLTFETAIQFPIVQNTSIIQTRQYSFFFGTRYVI